MQISFHPKAKKILIILGAIAVLGIAILCCSTHCSINIPLCRTTGTSPDAQAAVDAANSFLHAGLYR